MGQSSPIIKPSVPIEHAGLPAEAIRKALESILATNVFRDSLRLTSFLRYVVEAALTGRYRQIKAYTVAVEALGRSPTFDPQTDPIVRVEAGRLRHALARYYSGEGRNDSIVIDLPRGSYVPVFSRRSISANVDGIAAVGAHEAPSTVQIVLERLGKLRRQLALLEAEIESAATLLEQSRRTDNGRAA